MIKKKSILKSDKIGLIVALILIVGVFSVLTEGNFLSWANFQNIMLASAIVGLVTVGECYLIITAGVDLSPGSVAAFSGVFCALLLSSGMSWFLSILLTIIFGLIIGFFNAVLINKFEMEPFIATLASMSVFRGFAYIICDGKAVFISNQTFLKIGSIRIPEWVNSAGNKVTGIPLPFVICAVVLILGLIVLNKTKFGRSIYMVGGNKNAARLAGINEKRVKYIAYGVTAGLAALGGILQAARMSAGMPSASVGLEFDAVTAVILGGVAMLGGRGTLGGAIIGLFILQCFNNGLMMMNVPSFWQTVSKGVLLIIALAFDYLRRQNKDKKERALQLAEELKVR